MVKKIIAIYIGIGAIVCYLIYTIHFGLAGLLKYIIPTFITTSVFLFYGITSYFYFIKPDSALNKLLFGMTIFIQCFQLELGGLVFKNYYFPEASIVVNMSPGTDLNFDYHLFSYEIVNGYFHDVSNFRLAINLLEFILFLFVMLWDNRKGHGSFQHVEP